MVLLAAHRGNLRAAAGPVNIHERVMRAMTRPSQNHRDPWFNPWFSSILEEVKTIFKTKEGTTFIFPGTGTGADRMLHTDPPSISHAQLAVYALPLHVQHMQGQARRKRSGGRAQAAGSRL